MDLETNTENLMESVAILLSDIDPVAIEQDLASKLKLLADLCGHNGTCSHLSR